MTESHVIGNGVKRAEHGQVYESRFAGNNVLANFDIALGLTNNGLKHFALSSTASPLVHKSGDIVVGANYLYR